MRVTVSIFFGAAGRVIALSSLDLICVCSAWGGGNDISEKCGESYPTSGFFDQTPGAVPQLWGSSHTTDSHQ